MDANKYLQDEGHIFFFWWAVASLVILLAGDVCYLSTYCDQQFEGVEGRCEGRENGSRATPTKDEDHVVRGLFLKRCEPAPLLMDDYGSCLSSLPNRSSGRNHDHDGTAHYVLAVEGKPTLE